MNKTVYELGLSVVDFEPGYGFDDKSIVYLRGVHLKNDEIDGDKPPYGLKPKEKYKTSQELAW